MDSKVFKEKIMNGVDFTKDELQELTYCHGEGIKLVEETEGVNLRWLTCVQTILKVDDDYFALDWYRGKTEMQEDEFDSQPYQVTGKKIVVEKWEWTPVKSAANGDFSEC